MTFRLHSTPPIPGHGPTHPPPEPTFPPELDPPPPDPINPPGPEDPGTGPLPRPQPIQ